MNRRSGDEIERRITEWERTRDSLGDSASHGLVRYLNDEIDKLRHEKMMRDRPVAGGRRTTDPRTIIHTPVR
jgi:hypothetical protein